MGAYLPSSALPGLKAYKYASEDRSLTSKYILKPFYTRIVEFLPRWLAPNTVTLLGLLFSIGSFLRACYYNSGFNSFVTPRWVFYAHAFDLFAYQTLDALDGQQARRTGSSSPLGELFDHCVDAINTSLQAYVVASVFNVSRLVALTVQFLCTLNFFLSTWEEYHTHKLFLSAFSGPVEGILMLVGFEILTGVYGPQIWYNEVCFLGYNVAVWDILGAFIVLGLVFNSAAALLNVKRTVGTKFIKTLPGLLPIVVLWIGFGGWAFASWTTVNSGGFLPFFLAVAFTFALLVGRIITAHVTNQSYPMWTPLLAGPYVGLAAHYAVPAVGDLQVIWAICGLSFGAYGSFVAEIIVEITTYLDIGCFYIKHKAKTD